MDRTLTVFRGRAGDHNDRAMRGADLVGAELARQLDLTAIHVGAPEPALNADWKTELVAALPTLRDMSAGPCGTCPPPTSGRSARERLPWPR